ncbi:SDR family oxidoreductase [Actinoplanes sp. NPDC051494]|uniref:SDR family oxidoreductase n=1 Tax=Actinoplanes sp. NPDC051494 TaxID=3363907 RepID=UPI00378AC41C
MTMIVVTGATGNVGRPLVQALAAAGEKVTAVSRRVGTAVVPAGVLTVAADLTDPPDLRPVFDRAGALFLHGGGAGAQALKSRDILDAASSAGVGRVVLLSSQGVRTRPESESHGVLLRSLEEAVRGSGPDWTILRPGGFNSNMYAWSESVRTRRTVVAPFGDVGMPTIDPADIAGVAARALREDGHAGQIYELTWSALTTPRQRAEVIGAVLGVPLRFVEQTRDEARVQMLRFMPEWAVDTTLAVLGVPTLAEQQISPAVAQILGRAPRTFADWVQDHISAFR